MEYFTNATALPFLMVQQAGSFLRSRLANFRKLLKQKFGFGSALVGLFISTAGWVCALWVGLKGRQSTKPTEDASAALYLAVIHSAVGGRDPRIFPFSSGEASAEPNRQSSRVMSERVAPFTINSGEAIAEPIKPS